MRTVGSLLLTPQKLIAGSKKELLAILKQVDLTDFAPRHTPKLRIALLNIAFTQNPALNATVQRQATNHFPSSQVTKISLQRPPTALSTSPST